MTPTIKPATLKFLKDLAKNNNRDWFTAHKEQYLTAQQNMADFVDALIVEMNKHDELDDTTGKQSLYRIYNDIRFSKNKPLYKERLAFSLSRSSKLRRGGYYFNLKPNATYLAIGFFGPNPADLARIREDISYNYDYWNKLLKAKNMKQNFGALDGDKVATAPRGYDIKHPGIDLLRHKQFIFRHYFTDAEVTSPGFLKQVNALYKSARPWLNYMSEVLTTDANGEMVV